MKFILMMHARRGSLTGFSETGEWNLTRWPAGSFEKHMAAHQELNAELEKRGELVSINGLAPPKEAKLVKAGGKKGPITDGVFPEAKEFLAGWWIVDVKNAERAYEIAAIASAAPGPDGKPLNMEIEVRQVMG
jgi:hypothetical protein